MSNGYVRTVYLIFKTYVWNYFKIKIKIVKILISKREK